MTISYKNNTLKNSDLVLWSVHILVSLLLWITYKYEIIPLETVSKAALFYFWMVPGLLLTCYYRQLRSYKVYLLWLITGIIQLVVYFIAKDYPDFQKVNDNNLASLKTLLVMLLSFQFFRQLFKLLTPWELIITIKRFSSYDLDDKRKLIWLDYLFSLIIAACIVACFL